MYAARHVHFLKVDQEKNFCRKAIVLIPAGCIHIYYYSLEVNFAVLEMIFFIHRTYTVCLFKSSFWSDILQIGLNKITR